jgi:23S rRNA (uracil1939-C5)-methyltransferase
MYARVAELAFTAGGLALDLYAGLGGIGLHLARAGMRVIAVELDPDAVAALRRAAERAQLPLDARAGDAAKLAPELRAHAPSVVVVNPPRKGLSDGARELVVALAPPKIVYVSCGPESLARDLAEFARVGYTPDVIEPFDLMPGTAQVETVVRLTRDRDRGER